MEKKGTSGAGERMTSHRLARMPKDPAFGINSFLGDPNAPSTESNPIFYRKAIKENLTRQQRVSKILRDFDIQFEKTSKISLHPPQATSREAKRRDITDSQNEPDPEKKLHLSHLVDDLVNNIIHLQPDDQTCETLLTHLPQLLLLFAMRGQYQTKILAEVRMWLFVEKNRQ